jgi:hypothetical protein
MWLAQVPLCYDRDVVVPCLVFDNVTLVLLHIGITPLNFLQVWKNYPISNSFDQT